MIRTKLIVISLMFFTLSSCGFSNCEEINSDTSIKTTNGSIGEKVVIPHDLTNNEQECDDIDEYRLLINVNQLIDADDYYTLYTNESNTLYKYVVTDKSDNIIDIGFHDWSGGIDFSYQGELLELRIGYGGTYNWGTRYYDLANGNSSRIFQTPLIVSERLIAYFAIDDNNEITLYVQDIFDAEKYNEKIYRKFDSMTMLDTSDSEFINNTQLKITYATDYDNENHKGIYITEIFELNLPVDA